MSIRPTILMTLPLLMLFSCKSTRFTEPPKPGESYPNFVDEPVESTITVPINISSQELIQSINRKITGILYEDNSFNDNGNDGLMLRATKSRDIDLRLFSNVLKYRVPLKVWIKKSLMFGAAEAEGELALNFKTTYKIGNNWGLESVTEVEYHEWLAKPVLKTALGDLSIETIANLFLNRAKGTLSQSIDKLVREQLNLRALVQPVWNSLQDPTLLSAEYNMWIKTTPLGISMTPLHSENDQIRGKIAVRCNNDVSFGEKPTFRQNSDLPPLELVDDAPDEFQVRIATDVPFSEAERLAKNMIVGQSFESGKYKSTVENVRIWGSGEKLVVNALLSGSFKGNIYFIGKPEFNAAKNQIEMKDLDFHLDTKNFLHKSAAWLFKGTIRKKMADAMIFPIDENLKELRTSVQATLTNYQLAPGAVLNGNLEELTVEKTFTTPNSIRVNLFSKGKLAVDVKGL